MKCANKWRVEAKYYRGESGASSYSFTITLANIHDEVTKNTESFEMKNVRIEECIYELAMSKATKMDMGNTYPLISLRIRESR